jgi:enolase
MAKYMISVSVKEDFIESIKAIKKAFREQGYEYMFSSFAINSIIRNFEEKDWGEFLTNNKHTYTTAEVVHDSLQDELTGDEKWVKLI